jgi:ring-1,2-phenylacetyl-CoA epoxidase subunit PaaC
MNTKKALYNYCLRLADNNLIAGQRLAEWCSNGPILEEDLAMTNFALDYLGQAEFHYNYAAELEGKNRSGDEIAFTRSERQYFNCLLLEQPNGDFAQSMMKIFLYSAFAKLLLGALTHSQDERLAALATKGIKEIKYHFRHSSEWIIRFGNGTEESQHRSQFALNEIWPNTADLFEMNDTEQALISLGIAVDLNSLHTSWLLSVNEILNAANLSVIHNQHMYKGGYKGNHTEHLGHLLCEMQYLQRAHPGAIW